MTTNRLAALALFAGTAAGLVTMALHPTARDFMPGETGAYTRNAVAHSLALFAQPLILAGTLALTLHLRVRRDVAVAGYAFFAMATVAVMIAGVASGFLAPEFLQAHRGGPDTAAGGLDALNYTVHLNRAFAKVYVALGAIGILLWSVAMLAGRELSRALAIYGVALATGLVLGITSGLLRLDVHGFGLVVLGQGIWFVWVGALLWRASSPPTAFAS